MIRIMCIGPGRIYEAMVTLSFDNNLVIAPTLTYFISPYSPAQISLALDKFNLTIDYQVISDTYFSTQYDLTLWSHDHWYLQQALKLCAIDSIDSQYFLIHDADLVLLQPYTPISNDVLNFKAENLWNSHQHLYGQMIEQLLGLKRTIPCSLVNEIMPYAKQDWDALKRLIEERYHTNFLNAIANLQPLDSTKWFSEYELLGIYKTNHSGWTHSIESSQPPINSWDDFYNTKWSQRSILKFHTHPLKQMNAMQAHQVINFLKNLT